MSVQSRNEDSWTSSPYNLQGFNSKMTAEECEHFHRWEPGLALGTTLLCEAILVIRTYALWGRNKSVLALLATCFVAEACILFYAVFKFLPVPTQDPSNPASRGACIAGGGPGGRDWTMASSPCLVANRYTPDMTAGVLGLASRDGHDHVGPDNDPGARCLASLKDAPG